jgi:uncharacterized membrane protein
MSITELQNNLVRLTVGTEEKTVLEKVFAYFQQIRNDDLGYALSPEQEIELQKALEESYLEENLVDHDVVMKRYEKWLKD